MSDRITSLKEKFRLALSSTAKVISDDFNTINKPSNKKNDQDTKSIEIAVKKVLDDYGVGEGHIFNLGHGITQFTPVENVLVMLETIRNYSRKFH